MEVIKYVKFLGLKRVIAFILIGLLFLLALNSCGPASKLRRAEKLIEKAEKMGASWRIDSVQVEVPVIITETRVDTTIVFSPGKDVVIEKDRLKVVIRRIKGDTVKVEAECKADTIKIRITKTITKSIHAKGRIKWFWIPLAFGAGVVAAFIIRLVRFV